MARWTDIARWRGPSPNKNTGGQNEVRGLVVHIAAGWYEGTISWQKNPDADVSSHFVVGRDGQIAQMVDTRDAAWTQRSGNGEWLSVECEGFIKGDSKNPGGWERLSDKQLDAVARIFLRCHQEYGVPLQTTSSATGRGLGHHSMGADWGHRQCPGKPIIAQKDDIVARARALENGDDMPDLDDIAFAVWNYANPRLTKRDSYAYLRGLATDLAASKEREEAILAAIKGVDTKSILARIDQRAAESAARDAADAERDGEILALIQQVGSGEAAAKDVLQQIARLITEPRE